MSNVETRPPFIHSKYHLGGIYQRLKQLEHLQLFHIITNTFLRYKNQKNGIIILLVKLKLG